jgi:alpha-glucosidase (family GH31 glycosyl hydrolase)
LVRYLNASPLSFRHNVKIPGDFGTGWTGYRYVRYSINTDKCSWNEDLFPDPVDFMKSLRDRHLKVTLNLHPADGVRSFEKVYPEMCAALGRDPSEKLPIAFDCTNREFFDAYFNVLHRSLEDQGVDFWWIDWQQGGHSRIPGIDPMWMLNHFHYLDSGRRWDRQFTFSRYAGPGSHRYPIGFSGVSGEVE